LPLSFEFDRQLRLCIFEALSGFNKGFESALFNLHYDLKTLSVKDNVPLYLSN